MPVYEVKSKKAENGLTYRIVLSRSVKGETFYFSKRGFKSKEEAEDYEERAIKYFNEYGHFLNGKVITLEDVFFEWKSSASNHFSYNTIKSYSSFYNKVPLDIRNTDIREINLGTMQFVFDDLITKNHTKLKRVLFLIFNYAFSKRYIDDNIIDRIEIVPHYETEKLKEDYLKFEDMLKLVNALREKEEYIYKSYAMTIIIGYYSGMRIGEILALRWEDIDMNNCTISITKQLEINSSKNDEDRIKLPKTKASYDDITLSEPLKLELIDWSKENSFEVICSDNKGDYIEYRSMLKTINKVSDSLNIYYHPHMLRHTLATNIYNFSHDIKLVQSMLRHAHVQLTYDIYVHMINDEAKKTLDEVFAQCRD